MRSLIPALAAVLLAASPASAQSSYGEPVTLAQARAIVDAAHSAAQARKLPMTFVVALPSGDPILLEAMDGAHYGSITAAQGKARTAARYRLSTKVFADGVASGNGAAITLADMVAVEGGVPLMAGGRVIGALGVSGGTPAQDGEIAAAALANIKD